MTDEQPPDIFGGLPRTRPHRRSEKRAAAPVGAGPKQTARSAAAGRADLIGSAANMTVELAELGISVGARALRGVVARLPRR